MPSVDPGRFLPPALHSRSESAQTETVPPLSVLVHLVSDLTGAATGDLREMLPMKGAIGLPTDAYAAEGVTRGIATVFIGGKSTSGSGSPVLHGFRPKPCRLGETASRGGGTTGERGRLLDAKPSLSHRRLPDKDDDGNRAGESPCFAIISLDRGAHACAGRALARSRSRTDTGLGTNSRCHARGCCFAPRSRCGRERVAAVEFIGNSTAIPGAKRRQQAAAADS